MKPKINMNDFYFEICIKPNNFHDIFVSEILDFTNEAVEENILDEDKNNSIIIRTDKDIADKLIFYLNNLSENLSLINNMKVSFTYTITKKLNEDYIKKYKDSISSIECGRFYIYPPWLEAMDSKLNIQLEPSLAFGTGHHESTFMCIEALESCKINNTTTLLDVGCGSGILALCANKLGAKVSMCDIDELAISEAKKNFLKNNATITDIWLGSIDKYKNKYDIVVSNIVASVIIQEADNLIFSLKNNSYLVLSGILDEYSNLVKERFKSLKLIEEKTMNEWVCLRLLKI